MYNPNKRKGAPNWAPGRKKANMGPHRPIYKAKRASGPPAVQGIRSSKHETKSVDVAINLVPSTTPGFSLMNGTIPGTNLYSRVGRKIQMRSVRIRGQFTQASATTPGADYVRWMLIYDRQPNAAAPAITDILQDVTNAGSTQTNSYSGINMSNSERFAVLRQGSIATLAPLSVTVGINGVSQVGNATQSDLNLDLFVPLKNLETHYNAGTAGTVADITTGSLHLVTFGAQTVANAQFEFFGEARLRFNDL